jgi:magnesium transporter
MIWLKGKMLGGLMQIKALARRGADEVHLDYARAKSHGMGRAPCARYGGPMTSLEAEVDAAMDDRTGPSPAGRRADARRVSRYLVSNVPLASPHDSAAGVSAQLGARAYDDASHVFLLHEDHTLAGVIAIADLLAAAPLTPLTSLAHGRCAVVPLDSDPEDAASAAIRSGFATVAVVDGQGRFVGAIAADALMSILREEHIEDLHHMAGILGRSEAARAALVAPPHLRALYRLPWLLLGLLGSAIATGVMSRFESLLAANIAIAFFVPAIVYIADAVGTQAEAVAVRGISLTEGLSRQVLLGEFGTGVLIGGAFALLSFPAIWIAFGNIGLAATVALTLIAAASVATSIGVVLPWIFARLGYDPAYGSGPVATVIQDVVSLVIYFCVATALL